MCMFQKRSEETPLKFNTFPSPPSFLLPNDFNSNSLEFQFTGVKGDRTEFLGVPGKIIFYFYSSLLSLFGSENGIIIIICNAGKGEPRTLFYSYKEDLINPPF